MQIFSDKNPLIALREALRKKYGIILEFFTAWGGRGGWVDPISKAQKVPLNPKIWGRGGSDVWGKFPNNPVLFSPGLP